MPLPVHIKKLIKENDQKIEHIELVDLGLNDEDISELTELLSDNSHIVSLNLERNNINDKGAVYLKQLSHLRKLNLSQNNITDKGALLVAEIPSLQSLDLRFCGITTAGAQRLSSIDNLSFLDVSNNPEVNKKAAKEISAKYAGTVFDSSSFLDDTELEKFGLNLGQTYKVIGNPKPNTVIEIIGSEQHLQSAQASQFGLFAPPVSPGQSIKASQGDQASNQQQAQAASAQNVIATHDQAPDSSSLVASIERLLDEAYNLSNKLSSEERNKIFERYTNKFGLKNVHQTPGSLQVK